MAIALTTITSIPLSVSAKAALSADVIAQHTTALEKPSSVESIEIEQAEEPSRSPSSFQVEPRPIDPEELEATQTCDGFLACLDTLSFCDEVGGGMSTNPDGSMTCTY